MVQEILHSMSVQSSSFIVEREKCPTCFHDKFLTLKSLEWDDDPIKSLFVRRGYPVGFLNEGRYEICECLNCSLLFQKYVPSSELLDLIYNRWLKKRDNSNADIENYTFNPFSPHKTIRNISEINQIIEMHDSDIDNLKVLDFGMGWGGWSRAAHLMGIESYGSEISTSQIDYNKMHGIKVIPLEQIPDYKFSFINSQQVFEHLTNPYEVFSTLVKGLKNKGYLRISVPNSKNVKANLKKDFRGSWFWAKGESKSLNPVEPLQHINGFNGKSLRALGENQGLIICSKSIDILNAGSIGKHSFKSSLISSARPLTPIYRKFNSSTNLLFQKITH